MPASAATPLWRAGAASCGCTPGRRCWQRRARRRRAVRPGRPAAGPGAGDAGAAGRSGPMVMTQFELRAAVRERDAAALLRAALLENHRRGHPAGQRRPHHRMQRRGHGRARAGACVPARDGQPDAVPAEHPSRRHAPATRRATLLGGAAHRPSQSNALFGVRTPDGAIRWLRVNATPIVVEGRRRVVTSFVDVTVEVVASRELARARRRAGARARPGAARLAGEVALPRQHEPRDPYAVERHHRSRRAAAGNRAGRARRDRADLGGGAAVGGVRRPRPVQDRGRGARAGGAGAVPGPARAADAGAARHRGRPQGAHAHELDRAVGAGVGARRPGSAPAGPAEPGRQRGEVHRARQGRGRPGSRRRRQRAAALRGDRHRHRRRTGGRGQAVPALPPGGPGDQPPLRRDRAGPGHRARARHPDGRDRRRLPGARRGEHLLVHRPAGARARRGDGGAPGAGGCPPGRCWWWRTSRSTAGSPR